MPYSLSQLSSLGVLHSAGITSVCARYGIVDGSGGPVGYGCLGPRDHFESDEEDDTLDAGDDIRAGGGEWTAGDRLTLEEATARIEDAIRAILRRDLSAIAGVRAALSAPRRTHQSVEAAYAAADAAYAHANQMIDAIPFERPLFALSVGAFNDAIRGANAAVALSRRFEAHAVWIEHSVL